jgi:hypothetical protein
MREETATLEPEPQVPITGKTIIELIDDDEDIQFFLISISFGTTCKLDEIKRNLLIENYVLTKTESGFELTDFGDEIVGESLAYLLDPENIISYLLSDSFTITRIKEDYTLRALHAIEFIAETTDDKWNVTREGLDKIIGWLGDIWFNEE